jgi:ribonuclease H2 subunit A
MSDYIIGIDEAGRGPVLGPMVYGAAYCLKADSDNIKKLFKVDDSKKLNVNERERIQKEMLASSSIIKHNLRVIHALELSNKMLRRQKYNLNLISHDAAIELIHISKKQIENMGGVLSDVYIDTVGTPSKYQAKVLSEFPSVNIVVEKKADATFPIVSAASIFAKVCRDSIVESFGDDLGSGYPGDPNTISWLGNNKDPVFGYPSDLCRFSWSTVSKNLNDDVKVEWSDDEENEGRASKSNFSVRGDRDPFFGERKMKIAKLGDFDMEPE